MQEVFEGNMAGYQSGGIAHSPYPTAQQTSHHFHPHHHHLLHHHPHQHQQSHRSPPSSMECLASSSSSSISASGPVAPSSTSRPRFFSAVRGGVDPSSGEDFDQSTEELASTRRRHSEDPSTSNRLRSEWVTLSKAMLMVLVEKICQLSFENDAQTPMHGVESSATQRSMAATDSTSQARTVATAAADNGSTETGGCSSVTSPAVMVCEPPLVTAPAAVPFRVSPTVAPIPSTQTLPVAHCLSPVLLPPACDVPPSDAPPDSDDSIRAAEVTPHAIDASSSIEADAENTWAAAAAEAGVDCSGPRTMPSDAETEPPSAASSLNRRRGSRRTHAKAARGGGIRGRGAGKTEDAGVVERTEDKMRCIRMRPLRQRNCDRTVQPWVACNKSLVYSMIDNALGAMEPAAPAVPRQVVVTSPVALETGVRSRTKCLAAAGAKDADARGSGAVNARDDAREPPVRPPTRSPPDVTCDAPLLGALLSYDDAGVTNTVRDIPTLPTPAPPPPPPRHRRQHFHHHPRRGSSPVKAAIRRIGVSNWHRTFSDDLRVLPGPLRRRDLASYGCCPTAAQMVVDPHHPFVASPNFSAQVRNADEDLASAGSRSEDRNTLRTNAGLSGKSSRIAQQSGEGGSNNPRRSFDMLPSDSGASPTESRRMEARAKNTSSSFTVERPRWIALDKDEVRSLVDSLLSTMMTSVDDITRGSAAARYRSAASPGNAVRNKDDCRSFSDNDVGHHDNDETECKQSVVVTGNDSGRFDNGGDKRRSVVTDSGRYDDDDATIEYGRFMGLDLGRHDDGKRGGGGGCWRSRAMQCLATDESGDYPVEPGSVPRDNEGECSVARGVSEGLARSMMKWKSSMLMRLHSQSQDEEK